MKKKTTSSKKSAPLKRGKMSRKKVLTIGAIGAAVATIGAGAYYLLGPNAKEHQKKVKGLMTKMKKEVIKDVKKVKDLTAPTYNKIVDTVSETYTKNYDEYKKDIQGFAKKLKEEWEDASKLVKKKISSSKKKK